MSEQTLQENLRWWADIERMTDRTSECASQLIKAADRIDELERQLAEAQKDTKRIDEIANEYLQIEAFAMPTGGDDAVATYKRERDNLVKVNNDLMLALADIKAMNEDVTRQAEEFFKKYQGK